MDSEIALKDQIVDVGRRLYANKFIAAADGNISARVGDVLYFTPTGMCKGFLKPEDIVKTDLTEKDTREVETLHPKHACR